MKFQNRYVFSRFLTIRVSRFLSSLLHGFLILCTSVPSTMMLLVQLTDSDSEIYTGMYNEYCELVQVLFILTRADAIIY